MTTLIKDAKKQTMNKKKLNLKISRLSIKLIIRLALLFPITVHSSDKSTILHATETGKVCLSYLKNCINISQMKKKTEYPSSAKPQKNKSSVQTHYHEFAYRLDISKLERITHDNKLSKTEKRQLMQLAAIRLNRISINRYLEQHEESNFQNITPLPLNNSAIFQLQRPSAQPIQSTRNDDADALSNQFAKLTKMVQSGKIQKRTIALIDSGVSNNHQDLSQIKITQFNPANNNFLLKDTGLGHGTGVLSLIHQNIGSDSNNEYDAATTYLSCNGLPYGKYDFLTVLQCMNWLFMQPNVDVMINAWLVSQPGCHYEWLYPLQMTWAANTIPVFSVGNYSGKSSMDYSPANLSPFDSQLPLLTVGALNQKNQKLTTSSHGTSQCQGNRILPTVMAPGEKIKVAVPFTDNSYQMVDGSSYSVAFVGAALAELISSHSKQTNSQIVMAILQGAVDLGEPGLDSTFGYGKLNIEKSFNLLERSIFAENQALQK